MNMDPSATENTTPLSQRYVRFLTHVEGQFDADSLLEFSIDLVQSVRDQIRSKGYSNE